MSAKEFWSKVKDALKVGVHKFLVWLNLVVKPEMLEFLSDNKDLAVALVIKIGTEYAGKPSHLKFESVYDSLVEEFTDGDAKLTVDNQWIRLLIELAVTVAKATGEI